MTHQFIARNIACLYATPAQGAIPSRRVFTAEGITWRVWTIPVNDPAVPFTSHMFAYPVDPADLT